MIVAGLYAANKTFQPFHGEGEGTVAVTIPEGSDAGEIGKILAAAGVVDSARFFELNATVNGDRGELRPGKYTLKRGMKNGDAIAALQVVPEGPKAVETVDVRLLEGPSRKENAPVVDKSKKVKGDYASATSSKTTLRRIRELGAPRGTKTAEGFLFPATYTLPEGSTANRLVKEQLDAFEENFAQVDMSYAKKKNLTRYDVIDHRLDDRARGVARARAPARLGGHLQPAEGGYDAGDRRDDPLRDEQLATPDPRIRAREARGRTTPASTAGCRRRRSATPGSRR